MIYDQTKMLIKFLADRKPEQGLRIFNSSSNNSIIILINNNNEYLLEGSYFVA